MLKAIGCLCLFAAITFAMDSVVDHNTRSQLVRLFGSLSFHDLKRLLYVLVLLAAISWLMVTAMKTGKQSGDRERVLDLESPASRRGSASKAPGKETRPNGVWPPSEFKRPVAKPLLEWDVHQTEPRPYRPFRWGPYHITMGLRTMEWDDWIELDNHYLKYHADKKMRIEERGARCCRTAPEAMDGAIELLEELLV